MNGTKLWKVVGGIEKGGILVREGQEFSSRAQEERLETGSVIQQMTLLNERLKFRKLSGTGPNKGWISIRATGKDLVIRIDEAEAGSQNVTQDAFTTDLGEKTPMPKKQPELKRQTQEAGITPRGRTIVCVFAGRQRYLSILIRYLEYALMNKEIDEVHLWDLCAQWADRMYLQSLKGLPGVTVMHRGDIIFGYWQPVYEYYADPTVLEDDDVLIKCDDDIVYLSGLGKLATFTRMRSEPGIVFPNIVNNDVGTHWQLHDGMWKPSSAQRLNRNLSFLWRNRAQADFDFLEDPPENPIGGMEHGWHLSAACAEAALGAFLRKPSKFAKNVVHEWKIPRRVSINCFALRGRVAREIFPKVPWEDERFLSHDVMAEKSWSGVMLMSSVAVHFAFGPQRMDGLDKFGSILRGFEELADLELTA